jgi:hypothetical protein
MPGTEGNTDVSDVPVEPLDEVGRRRQLKAAMTAEHSTREERGSSAFDTGYEFTLDLADTAVNLPEEELNPNVDEILHRYEASAAEASAVPSSETVGDPDADEILAAISTHHGKSQPHGPRPAPRGSADLSPAAPKIKRRISLTPPPLRLRSRAHARTALAVHDAMGAPAASASRRRNTRRSRVVVAVFAVTAVASTAVVVSLSGKSAKVPSNTTASRTSVVEPSLIATNTGTGLLFHFLPRREFAWGALPLVPPKTKSRTPSKTETRRTKAQTRSSHYALVRVTRPESGSAPTNSSQTTATNSTHSSQSSTSRTSATGSSAGCQGAGVMAPTNCGKPSL